MARVSVGAMAAISLLIAAVTICIQPARAAVQPARTRAVAATACSPAIRSVALSPASVPGGAASWLTVTLTCSPAKAQTITVKGFAGIRVPATLHVPAGRNSAWSSIPTATRKTAEHGWITATLGRSSVRALLTVGATPKTCSSPTLSATTLPTLAYVGDHAVLGITLSCTPAKAVRLALTSTRSPSAAPVLVAPTTVTVGAYYRGTTVTLAPKAYQPGQYKATVLVRLGSRTLSRTITVDPGLSDFDNSPDSCSPNDLNLYIFFTGNIPAGGLTVKLKSDNAAVKVPATVAYTQQGSIGGGLSGVTVSSVSVNTKVTLTATMSSRTLTFSIVLLAAWRSGDKITLVPSPGPGPFYGPSGYEYLIYLSNPAPAAGLTGTATTDSPNDVQLQGNPLNIVGGCDSTVISFEVPYELAPVHATVTVSIGGSTASAPLTIEPSLASVTLPPTIVGGDSGTGTVTLTGAPDAPETVYLNSTWGILTIGSPVVTIPAGQTSAQFTFSTVSVDSDADVTVIAQHIVDDLLADSVTSNTIDVTP
jgi:hypothetical protein